MAETENLTHAELVKLKSIHGSDSVELTDILGVLSTIYEKEGRKNEAIIISKRQEYILANTVGLGQGIPVR